MRYLRSWSKLSWRSDRIIRGGYLHNIIYIYKPADKYLAIRIHIKFKFVGRIHKDVYFLLHKDGPDVKKRGKQ